ncbi:MAG TPA: formyltransferase family protein [Patescibacteria group bacterium]
MINTIFFGSSDYSLFILEKLLSLPGFKLSAVVTKEDKPAGRDQKITPNPVALYARNHNLNLISVSEFSSEVKAEIKSLRPELGLCVAFGPPFFDREMIDIFPHQIVNIHPSPLPRYRGATPGPWQIINGEQESAVTFFVIDELPDHGPVVARLPFQISPAETSATFYNKAFSLAADNLDTILKNYINNPAGVTPQDHNQKTYFPRFTKDNAKIDWSWPSDKIYRFINAMLPWPVAWTEVTKDNSVFRMKVISSHLQNNELILDTVRIEGKNETKWSEIQKYYQIKK